MKTRKAIILSWVKNSVQVVKTTYIYAEKENKDSVTTYNWDGEKMYSVGDNKRLFANEIDIELPLGIDSVYKISKNNSSAKPSITFGKINLNVKTLLYLTIPIFAGFKSV